MLLKIPSHFCIFSTQKLFQIFHQAKPVSLRSSAYRLNPFGLTMAGISSKAAGSLTNKNKYNGKEEQRQEFSDGSGLEWLDYGARMYDNQVGRFFTHDRFSENFDILSPFNYCANNPISNVDINGDFLVDKNGIVPKYVAYAENRVNQINQLLENGQLLDKLGIKREDAEMVKNIFIDILKGVNELKKSDETYEILSSSKSDGKGKTFVELETGNIQMQFAQNASNEIIGHELTHGIQYERGEISFARDPNKRGVLYDISDETNAIKNARISDGPFNINDIVNDSWTRQQDPSYQNLPSGPININSRVGKSLRNRTANEGKAKEINSEFYKGWRKDYKKYLKQ